MANFFVLVLFGLIGSIFGPVGFFIGVSLGVLGWVASNKEKKAAANVPAKVTKIPVLLSELPADDTANAISRPQIRPAAERAATSVQLVVANGITSRVAAPPSGHLRPNGIEAEEYNGCVVQLCVMLLSFCPDTDASNVSYVTDLLTGDDWIDDKYAALGSLATQLQSAQGKRRDSPMVFELQRRALLERVARLPGSLRIHLDERMDALEQGFFESGAADRKEYVEALRRALRRGPVSSRMPAERQGTGATGTTGAQTSLVPTTRYAAQRWAWRDAPRSRNIVLKSAVGAFGGVLAADAVRAALMDTSDAAASVDVDGGPPGTDDLRSQQSLAVDELGGDGLGAAGWTSADQPASQSGDDFSGGADVDEQADDSDDEYADESEDEDEDEDEDTDDVDLGDDGGL